MFWTIVLCLILGLPAYIILHFVRMVYIFWSVRTRIQLDSDENAMAMVKTVGGEDLCTFDTKGNLNKKPRTIGPNIDGKPCILFTTAEQAKQIFNSGIDKAAGLNSTVSLLIGWGLVTMPQGDLWKIHRRVITPLFHFNALKEAVPDMILRIDNFLDGLQKQGSVKQLEAANTFEKVSMFIIIDLAFGNQFDAEYLGSKYLILNSYFTTVWLGSSLFGKYFQYLPFPSISRFRNVKRDVDTIVIAQIKKKRKELRENPISIKDAKASKDLISLLITSEEHQFTDEEILEECLTFLFGGQDTISSSLAWVMYFLGANPEYQQKLREEANEIFSKYPDICEAQEKLELAKAVFKETLRMRPALIGISKDVPEDMKIDGIFAPKDSLAIVAARLIHHDESIYPEPFKFKPERWLQENPNQHPFGFLAFGAGQRNCIGMKFAQQEARLILARLFQRFRIETNITKDIKSTPAIFKPKDLTIRFIPWE